MLDGRLGSSDRTPSLRPGAALGRYQLLCVVAHGGMGSVWAARLRAEHGFERKVAIKTILPQHAAESRFRNMFLDEARLASRIIHANVVQVLDLAEQDGVLFQAMEWVEGDSLRSLATIFEENGETLPWPIAIRIVLDVAKGLHAAHELRDEQGTQMHVVHRDVSPQNIMLGLDGSVRISDFGIAKARDRLSPETSKGHIKGKLRYMAPEQALGKPIDRRADIWSLAAILYELMTNRPLFDAPNEAALLYDVVSTPPTLLFEQPVHPRLLALLRRAVSRSPDGRHATAEEFSLELRRAAKEAGLEATTEDLAKLFQARLGRRCDERRKRIELSTSRSITLPSAQMEGIQRSDPNAQGSLADRGESDRPDSVHHPGTLSLVHSVRASRRTSWIVGSLLLLAVGVAAAWLLVTPAERLTAQRFVFVPTVALPVPEPTASPAASSPEPLPEKPEEKPENPPAAATATRASWPKRPPPPRKDRPPFDEIDDGF